jgi:hypothetical protein
MGSHVSKPLPPMPWVVAKMTNETRCKEGADFLSVIWATVAEQVVETAVCVYELSPEQSAALRQAFLRGVTFAVEPVL